MANGTATMPDAVATREVATIGSRLSFKSAFHPAWQAAAASTARKTKRSIACGRDKVGGRRRRSWTRLREDARAHGSVESYPQLPAQRNARGAVRARIATKS